MADVFISYHEASAGELAAQIAAALEGSGIFCWVARRDMPLGGDFSTAIAPQINACKLFLFLMNAEACQSEHVHTECGFAFDRHNKRRDIELLPLNIGNVQWKDNDWARYYFFHKQCVPFSAQPNAQELNQLTARVAQLLNREPPVKITEIPFMAWPCGDVTCMLKDGTFTVFGNGSMRNYTFYHGNFPVPWWKERNEIRRVEVEDGVTYIGDWSFHDCPNLTQADISNSVKAIGHQAFTNCAGRLDVFMTPNTQIERDTFSKGTFMWVDLESPSNG